MAAISTKYNFSKIQKGEVYRYVDMDNAVSLLIVKSGWNNKYDCIIESGEYESVNVSLFTAQQIQKYYGITTFLRKEKLIKINKTLE